MAITTRLFYYHIVVLWIVSFVMTTYALAMIGIDKKMFGQDEPRRDIIISPCTHFRFY